MIFQPHLLPQFAQYKSVNKKFKLNLCKDYEIAKKCPMDIRCHYAHGKHELRKFDDVLPSQLHPDQLATPVVDTDPNNPKYHNNLIYDKNIQAKHYNEYLDWLQDQQKKLTRYKIQYTFYCFDQLLNQNQVLSPYIAQAQELWKQEAYDDCIQIINSIMMRPDQTDDDRNQEQQIISEVDQLAVDYFKHYYCKKYKIPKDFQPV